MGHRKKQMTPKRKGIRPLVPFESFAMCMKYLFKREVALTG